MRRCIFSASAILFCLPYKKTWTKRRAVIASTPNIKWALTFLCPRTRTYRPPTSHPSGKSATISLTVMVICFSIQVGSIGGRISSFLGRPLFRGKSSSTFFTFEEGFSRPSIAVESRLTWPTIWKSKSRKYWTGWWQSLGWQRNSPAQGSMQSGPWRRQRHF